jgi:pyruvate dehydrogenase E1 component beta subunit
MERDPAIVVFGEDVAKLGGVFGCTRGLAKEFGAARVFDTPISETAFLGMAVGAAQAGLRPVVELMFVDFLGVCLDQIANEMAKNHYMSGGRVRVPLVLRTAVGSIGSAAQHSQVLSATFAHFPGLRVVFPGTPADLQQLLVAAIRSDDPVIFLEHKWLLKTRVSSLQLNDALPPEAEITPVELGKLRVIGEGRDLAIVSAGYTVQLALEAAEELRAEGLGIRVVDVRTLVPLDRSGLAEEAKHVRYVLVVDEDYRDFGMTGEVMASVCERLGNAAPRMARHALEVPLPSSAVLEREVLPSSESIAAAARRLVGL